jgi:hypothetical protein
LNIELLNKDIFTRLAYFILFLLLANVLGIVSRLYLGHDYIHGLIPLFDFDRELNIPTLYSSFAAIAASILLLVIALAHRAHGSSWLPWMWLSAIFLFLSIDETAGFHEQINEPCMEALNTSGLFRNAWVIPYGIAVGLFVICYLKFLFALPRRTMVLFVVSGSMFVSGAIGFEMLGARHVELYGSENLFYSVYYTCEELLEILGTTVFIYALLSYIDSQFSSLTLTIGGQGRTNANKGN